MDRGHLTTEQPHPGSYDLDLLSVEAFLDLCQQEDYKVIAAVGEQKPQIAQAIRLITEAIRAGGRLFYVGAGTSGRLGVLDAAECPPTFCTPPDLIQGIIAGGVEAMVRSSEGLEDDANAGAQAIQAHQVNDRDVVMGITAGGTTPYVHGALTAAQQLGAKTIFFTCVPPSQVPSRYDLDIRPIVGAEILTGSTRLKAGTATKLVLNMISTGVMIQLGKVYGNRMVDVAVTNNKLTDRALRILTDLLAIDRATAFDLLERAGRQVKTAIVMYRCQTDRQTAEAILQKCQGYLRLAIENHNSSS
ncbi:MAG: N-acetylmuramic acid 6-phosphate etherase [Pseudanabaenaceae cyanobacterium SKYGB_i_bin29]|nr:N-acetylmuramic acid 6-phosphate etherase [Pseudanabaenaceae cyanobacterium SKYG29]MDW8420787.1 N-acetylmuramic acid 6-phosphate etherase [Pseudanabaenaceae cyanobacterium SKYGB_i_bin29]